MIKRLIFDLDNTLILWKDEYRNALKEVLKVYNMNNYFEIIDSIIGTYEKSHDELSKESLLKEINNKCNLNLDISFIDELIKEEQELAEYDSKTVELFEYLSSKYEIVLLTNWFLEAQEKRLEKLGIHKYFNEFYGAENSKLKPDTNSYMNAIGDKKEYECIMIGDNIQMDLEPARNLGLDTILVDLKNKYKDTNYKRINSLYKLKEML